jgi:hypothetical protein
LYVKPSDVIPRITLGGRHEHFGYAALALHLAPALRGTVYVVDGPMIGLIIVTMLFAAVALTAVALLDY